MEATALSIGKAVLDGALSYAQSAVAEEVALQLGVRRDQVFITNELEMMQAFLMSADEERDDNKVVRVWVKQVRDVAYDVEDCLLDLAVRLDKQSWWRIGRTLLDRHYVAQQMKELRANVEDVSLRNQRYSLIKSSKPAEHPAAITGATTVMSGRDEARRQRAEANLTLVRLITDSKDNCLRVISVWGQGCTGDLTHVSIVKRAYHHIKMQKKFECQAFIGFVHPFCLMDFFQDVVQQFYTNSLQEAGELEKREALLRAQLLKMMGMTVVDDLARELNKYLNEMSYLIVLDNINTIEDWEHVKTCFPDNKKGSRILVSTQKVGVASLCLGADNGAPEHKQLFADQTLHVFYKKGSPVGTDSTETAGPSSNMDNTACSSSSSNETMLPDGGSELIGRGKDKTDIIRLIENEEGSQELQVVSVWGMGGLGKTTLVRDVYQSQELSRKFENRACVTIMRPFNLNDLLTDLCTQLLCDDQEKLMTLLEGKKYLIVLDDLLFKTEWDKIKTYFPANNTSGRIIVTTRVKDIATHCSNKHKNVYELPVLGHKDALDLFVKKVFPRTPANFDEQYPELVEPAKQILKKCNGLPLAIVTIGGFLSNQPKTALEWMKLNEHINVELEMNPELGAIKTILMKSYDGLPYHLKACFLYVPIFPEDTQISCKRLLRRWTAEGYAMAVRNKSAEIIAEEHLMELINRSMLMPSEQSMYSIKKIDSCKVHDLLREIGISQSMAENIVFRLDGDCSSNTKQSTARHLSINGNWQGGKDEFESMVDMPRVRSITVFGEWKPFFVSDKMRMLRVLDLEDAIGLVGRHLEHVWRLLHLIYLSLRGCKDIHDLPDSLGNLRQLETLDVRNTSIVMLPKAITKLEKLRYLHARKRGDSPVTTVGLRLRAASFNWRDAYMFTCCWRDASGADAVLGEINRGGVMLPRGSRNMKALHTLRDVDLASGADAVLGEISGLTGLRKLGLINVTKENAENVCSVISDLSNLESLSLLSNLVGDKVQPLYLGLVSSPPKNLQILKLSGHIEKLPGWIEKLRNLVKLTVIINSSCQQEHNDAIHILGGLPNLSILRLIQQDLSELHFKGGAFVSLKVLNLVSHSLLVNFEDGAMPRLEQLEYWGFGPNGAVFSGLEFLSSIWKIDVGYYFLEDDQVKEFLEQFRQLHKNPNWPKILWSIDLR